MTSDASGACPCLCGHAIHLRGACADCGCPRAAPDYAAPLVAAGANPALVAHARASAALVAVQLGYTGPARGPGVLSVHTCFYCGWTFRSARSHASTCCGACRQAVSAVKRLASEADIPSPGQRADTFSEERYLATGNGVMTATESYHNDLRVWRSLSLGD